MNTQKNAAKGFDIESGPSREDLFDALRLPLGLTVSFKLKGIKEPVQFVVDGIGDAENNKTIWHIKVTNIGCEYLPIYQAGWYDTKNRKGYLEPDEMEGIRLRDETRAVKAESSADAGIKRGDERIRPLSFAELEKKTKVNVLELLTTLEDYVNSGSSICDRVVIKIITRTEMDDDDVAKLKELAKKGVNIQNERCEARAAEEYQRLLLHLNAQ